MKGNIMKTQGKLTSKEEEVMEFFWSQDGPVTSVDILKRAGNRTWKDNYLQVMLRSLLKKRFIHICGTVQYGTQYARQFEPIITREQYALQAVMARGHGKTSLTEMAVTLAKEIEPEEKEEVIAQLEEIIRELKEK